MAKPTPAQDEPDADDTMGQDTTMAEDGDMPMTGGVPDGHAQAAARNADSMNSMQQNFRQRMGKSA